MEIPIDTTYSKFFRQYLEIINLITHKKITKGELDVLGKLMYLNYKYKDIDVKSRAKILFDYDTKIGIMDELHISMATMNNILYRLRKVKVIKNNTLQSPFNLFPNKMYNINFKFKINDKMDI